jgi:hypothetical protein
MARLLIAKSGGSVSGAEKDLVFTSDRGCLMEQFTGRKTITGRDYVQHGLGYYPAYTVFGKKITSDISGVPNNCWTPVIGIIGNATNFYGTASVDTDKLYLEPDDDGGYITTEYFYSIFGNAVDDSVGSGNNNVSGKLKIAKPGYSVPNITDARQFQFFSGANVFKQDKTLSGTRDITFVDYDFTVVTVAHNLGYVPIVYAFEIDNGSRIPYGNPDGTVFTYFIDSTNLYLVGGNLMNALGGDTYTVKYTITRDKIA